MIRITSLLVFLFFPFFIFGQFTDVIVLTKGESIVSNNQNFSKNKIYYNILQNDKRSKTNAAKEPIKSYNKNHISYKVNGRSKGPSIHSNSLSVEKQLHHYKKNVICLELIYIYPGVYYERRIPLSKMVALGLSAGTYIFIYSDSFLSFESKLVFGGPKHFFDIALGIMGPSKYFFDGKYAIVGNFSYQYTAKKGFTFKIGGGVMVFFPVVKLGIAYNF